MCNEQRMVRRKENVDELWRGKSGKEEARMRKRAREREGPNEEESKIKRRPE